MLIIKENYHICSGMVEKNEERRSTSCHKKIARLILDAKEEAYRETSIEPEPELTRRLNWPIQCTVGPGLEGALLPVRALQNRKKIMGFGHRVYKAYDPRARILGPLAKLLIHKNPEIKNLFKVAYLLERRIL